MDKNVVFFIPSIEEGGVEKNLYIISNYLSKKKININILTCNFDKKIKFNKKVNFIGPNNLFFIKNSRLFKTIICIFYLLTCLLKSNSKTLVFSLQANLYAIIISKITFTKVIVRANSSPAGWTKNNLKRIIYKFIINFADDVMVNSEEFKKRFYKVFKVKAKCIFNPFDKYFVLKKLNKSATTFSKKKSLKILSIGRLTNQKDHLTLLKAAKHINLKLNPEIVIIGKGYNYNKLKFYIKNNNLEKKVKLLGYQSNPYNFLKKTDILILTSRYEGLPNVLLEAQFLKKYIISTRCSSGPREILLNGKAGDLFEIGNYKNLAKIINSYPNKKKVILKKINFGTKNFNRYNYKSNCEKYFHFINQYF